MKYWTNEILFDFLQMAWKYLQISLVGFSMFFIYVLCIKYYLPYSIDNRAKTVSKMKCFAFSLRFKFIAKISICKFILHRVFEGIVKYCATYSNLIPLSFVLGFYVTIVMTRWWNQYTSIPWPDTFAVFVSANIHGQVT